MADDGTLLQDSDGNVYYIPNDDLAKFQVSGAKQQAVNENLDKMDDEVGGFTFDRFNLRPGIKPLKAFQGPLGWKVASPDDNSDTVVQT